MRALLALACVVAVSCGKPGESDAGTGGGSGATGGGAGGGAGGYTLKVVDGSGAAVAGVGARIENADAPWRFVEGTTDANGVVTLPATVQNPFHLTVAKAGHGVLSLLNLSSAVPPEVRLEALAPDTASTANLSGSISGAAAGSTVIVSSFDTTTAFATAPNYTTTYRADSALPLPLVALHLNPDLNVQNWAVVEGAARGGPLTLPVALPSPPAEVTGATFTGSAPFTGLLQQATGADRLGLHLTDDGAIVTGYGEFTATPGGSSVALTGTFTGITGPWAPNRLQIDITDQASFVTHYYQGGNLTQTFTVNVMTVEALETEGSSLGDLRASATAPGFDVFALTVAAPGSRTNVWRAYTTPGTAFTIKRLPALPNGATPATLGLGGTLEATAQAIKFGDPNARAWSLPNRTGPLLAYRQTFDTTPRVISGDWRTEPVEPRDQVYAFKVVTPSGAAFPNAAVRVELQSDPEETFVEGRTGNDGLISLTLSVTGPVNLTVTGANSGAVSFLGLTDDLPTEVRLDPLGTNSEAVADLSVTVTDFDGGALFIDSFAMQDMTSGSLAQTSYVTNATLPLPVLAMQLTLDGGINNWAVIDAGTRGGSKDFTISMPDPAQAVSAVTFTASWPASGLFAEPATVTVSGLHMTQPTEGSLTAGVATFERTDAGVISGAFSGVTGPLAPNRLVVEVSRGVNRLHHYYAGSLTAPVTADIPSATAIASTGGTLGTVAASATGDGFHSLELQLSKPGQPRSPWRVYTGPGAPLSISRLPSLPYGDAPASLGFGMNDQITAVPRLIRFPVATMRPWQLANSVGGVTGYETTVTGAGNNVTGTWR